MGDAKKRKLSTAIFLAQNPKCCFCGGISAAASRDHYPPRAIFDGSIRPDELVVPACDSCNACSKDSDQIVAAISRWRFHGDCTEIEGKDSRKFARGLLRSRPDIVGEWLSKSAGTEQKRARRILAQRGSPVNLSTKVVTFGPLTIPHLHLFSYKLTLATYYAHSGQLLPAEGVVRAYFRTKEDLAADAVPKEIFDYLGPNSTLRQGEWNVSNQFEYRIGISDDKSVFAMAARIRDGLLIFGFAATDKISFDTLEDRFCISPTYLRKILADPIFQKRI